MSRVSDVVWNEILPRSPVFTTGEVARRAGVTSPNASAALSRMADRDLITRVRRGLWAITGDPEFDPHVVVPHLFEREDDGYVSFFSALSLHGMIDQIPRMVEVASRVNKKTVQAPFATYDFHQIQRRLFGGFEPVDRAWSYLLATPEKALFDVMYIGSRKGRQFSHLPELSRPRPFSERQVEQWISKLRSDPIVRAVSGRWERVRKSLG